MEEEASKKSAANAKMAEGRIALLGHDPLQNILSRLPAISFAHATCVCRTWRNLCDRILFSRPKLLSALSLNPRLQDAFDEVSSKILSEPIRPHFAIVFTGRNFDLRKTHALVRTKFGVRIPVISCVARGIIGKDALSNEVKEVKWNASDVDESGEVYNTSEYVDRGIVLIVGFVPGLKVNVIPLLRANEISCRVPLVESFLRDIKTYTASVSDCNTPMGIVMFADHDSDVRFVLEKMDCALGGKTVILGDQRGYSMYSSGDGDGSEIAGGSLGQELQTPSQSMLGIQHNHDAVALVFAKDRDNTPGIGEIHFNLALSAGVSSVGPIYKAASVRVTQDGTSECCTWLTARREGYLEKLDGQRILSDLEGEIENDKLSGDFYMGVMKQRKRCKSGKGKFHSSFAFYEVISGNEEYLFVEGNGIRTGDAFRFYLPSVETALASRNNVFEELKALKNGRTQDGKRVEVFGGLIFTCFGRGESFFGDPNVDSSAFSETFPGIPLAGMFSSGEIGRLSSRPKDGKELNPTDGFLHVYSSVYLVMCYVLEPLEC